MPNDALSSRSTSFTNRYGIVLFQNIVKKYKLKFLFTRSIVIYIFSYFPNHILSHLTF